MRRKRRKVRKKRVVHDLDSEDIIYVVKGRDGRKRKFKLKMSDKLIEYRVAGKKYVVPIFEEIEG